MRPLPPTDPRALVPTKLSDHEKRITRLERDPSVLPRARALRDTNQSITNAIATVVTLPTEDGIDTHAFHSTAVNTSRMTIPTGMGGDYMISAVIVWASNATGWRQLILLKNGAQINSEGVVQGAANGVTTRQSFTTLLPLIAGDYVEIRAEHNSGGPLNVTNASLQIVKVG